VALHAQAVQPVAVLGARVRDPLELLDHPLLEVSHANGPGWRGRLLVVERRRGALKVDDERPGVEHLARSHEGNERRVDGRVAVLLAGKVLQARPDRGVLDGRRAVGVIRRLAELLDQQVTDLRRLDQDDCPDAHRQQQPAEHLAHHARDRWRGDRGLQGVPLEQPPADGDCQQGT
jgi:hypothetical protein